MDHLELSSTDRQAASNSAGALLELGDVSFSAEARVLLRPLSLTLRSRQVTGLIGHNGSGKSTLIKILARQQAPSAGRVIFEGQPIDDWGARAFARKVAYLPQYTPQAEGMLVRELVALGRYPWHGALGRFSKLDREKVEEAIDLTDIRGFADRLVDTLSGGERQRVWLAMLVAQDAEWLLLDEPISALDVAHQVEILSLVHRLSQQKGLGVVVVLHDVNMAARYCDEIIALHSGKMIARGTPDEIMTPESLAAIYGINMDVIKHPSTGVPVSFVR
ncbi:ATP-binding cassette domain-containing protein [Phyllobacterium sp. 21LDTY02-6]|uniref:ATP-binding cassette domain-containing protein n=1 Tax=unclassified Phyllobacterium TaxID=2638441 RepID=UPI0020203D19|nr:MULTISPECIES: ATP-binding cassette domain-containing protein [unclassified Phyllobacterium]MCO4319452.1 ATP-binding cassette domain-containing protein [Phyllobacterium sp. 21LDTY02-6]MCX8279786.1 ATP-binding cassette domain-containing protein [Phyllobacterium sp. 0TCS1.6C]MCX8295610.1 ATP-binding cassette domain-containing protein [Phyllobacterium sp. 0TCS1.6A]